MFTDIFAITPRGSAIPLENQLRRYIKPIYVALLTGNEKYVLYEEKVAEQAKQIKDYKKTSGKITADIRIKAQSSELGFSKERFMKRLLFFILFCCSKWLHPHMTSYGAGEEGLIFSDSTAIDKRQGLFG